MRNVFALTTSLSFLTAAVVWAGSPLSSVQVTLRGKKYDVSDVTTVQELQERLGDASGVDPSKQGRVLFDGQRLSPTDSLTDKGVQEGAQINIVPKKKSSTSSKSTSSSPVKAAGSTAAASTAAAASASSGSDNPMKQMMEMAGIDSSQLDELVKSMGGDSGEPPSMQESMQMMSTMMNSPIFQEYMNDPAKLEESRQMILNNPMLKSMMAGMPGMDQLLNDKDAWAATMQAAASMYSNMDSNDLMQALMGASEQAGAMGGMGGGGGMPPGLFDGMDMNMNSAASSALDELSEGEDE